MDFEAREKRWRVWMTAAQGGDAASYEKLLAELLAHLRGFVGRRVADRDALEDVVQNVLFSIHRARHTYRAERPFGPWLHAIARNAIIDASRARGRRTRHESSLEDDGVAEPAAPPERAFFEDDLSPELSGALASLAPGQRQAVELLHVQGLSVAEAAQRVGISQSALKVRAHRGYRALRVWLEGES